MSNFRANLAYTLDFVAQKRDFYKILWYNKLVIFLASEGNNERFKKKDCSDFDPSISF